jgi:hypothetical protein
VLTLEKLNSLFLYERSTHKLLWTKEAKQIIKRITPNTEVGYLRSDGYRAVRVQGKAYYVHRLIFWIATGEEAKGVVDHIDHNRSNNDINNLRDVSIHENAMNKANKCRSSTGYQGIFYDRRRDKYVAQVRYKGVKVLYKYCSTIESAVEAREAKLKELGFSTNHET